MDEQMKHTAVTKSASGAPGVVKTNHEGPVYAPRSDVYEKSDGFLLVADLPGVSEKNVEVSIEKSRLLIAGRVERPAPSGYELAYSEYRAGFYRRTFAISDEIDTERISASMKNGVLEITLPKKEAVKARTIEVKTK